MQKKPHTKKRSLMMVILAVVALTVAGTALAQGHGRHGECGKGSGFGPGNRLEVLAERLELTEDQVTAIEGIRGAGQEKNIELRKELMQLDNDLQGELLKDEPSEKAALDLVKKIGAVKTEMESNRMANRLEVRQQLTPEQQDKMLMMKERGKGGKGGKGCRSAGHRAKGLRGGECDGSGHGRGAKAGGSNQ